MKEIITKETSVKKNEENEKVLENRDLRERETENNEDVDKTINKITKELLCTTKLALNLARKERKLKQLSSLELMRLIDIGITKYQLLTGQATSRSEILPSREQMIRELRLASSKNTKTIDKSMGIESANYNSKNDFPVGKALSAEEKLKKILKNQSELIN